MRKTDEEIMTRLDNLLRIRTSIVDGRECEELNTKELIQVKRYNEHISELQWVCGFGGEPKIIFT
jgi:hypothetical protein